MNPQATGGSADSGTEPNTVTSKLASAGVQSNLSRSQLMIWTGQQLNPGVPLYNMALRFDLQGDIEVEVFQSAFQALIDRCDAMRTVFAEQAGVPIQHVQPRMSYRMQLVDLADEPDVAAAVEKWILQRSQQEFDLAVCCFDSALIKTGPASFVWYLNQHHLTTDAWSTSLIYRELALLYARLLAGGLQEDEESIPAYADYLAHERKQRGTPVYTNAVAYWDELAARPTPHVNLYGQNPAVRGNRTERLVCPLGQGRSQALRKLAETPGIRMLSLDMTLFNLFATVLFAYLYRVGGHTTQVIGTPAHNRSSLAFRETVGLFIELFPLRVELQEEETFRSLLGKAGTETQAYLRNVVPGASSPNVMRLFNVVLNYIHASFESFNDTPMQPQWVHTGYGDPEHDLRLQVHDFGGSGSLVACFDFNCTTFPSELRQHAMQHFLRMLDACLADPDQQIGTVELTSAEERRRYVVDFNHARKQLASRGTVIDLFRQQSRLNPGRTAVSLAGTTVSYRELDERSDHLARLITGRGVGRGVLVGIYIERSIEMVLGILAVLKAGAAYVPLESSLPVKRLTYILEDTGAHMVLTRKGLEARLPATGPQRYYLDSDREEAADQSTPLPDSDPKSTAYVIYTSGSTGMPKGVVVDHEGLNAYAGWARKTFTPQDQPVFPLYSP